VSRCGLKVFPPQVYTAFFGGDVKPLVLYRVGLNRLQALVSHYCGKPLRGNSNQKISVKCCCFVV